MVCESVLGNVTQTYIREDIWIGEYYVWNVKLQRKIFSEIGTDKFVL